MNRKSSRVFYGWWIVWAGFIIALYTDGVVFYGFTAVFEPIVDEFGWSYTQISLAASLRGLGTAFSLLLIGLLVDRWGPRSILLGGTIVLSLGLTVLSRTSSLGMLYGAFALVSIGISACSSTVMMTAIANWFHKKAGIAGRSPGLSCGGNS